MKRKISLAYLTIPGVHPLDQIKIAAEAGYEYVSLRTIPMGQPGEPQVCLEKDPELFMKVEQALKETGLKMLDIELVRIREDLPDDYRAAFERGAKLGATEILSSVWTDDRNLAVERYGKICEQAAEFNMNVNLEFPIVSNLKTLDETCEVQDQVGAKNLKLLMDMIYCHWDNVTPEKLKAMDPNRFGLIHLCDVPKEIGDRPIVEIVREGREYCGIGAADLVGMIGAMPAECPCSIELPNLKYLEQYGKVGHAKNCLEYAKKVIEQVGF